MTESSTPSTGKASKASASSSSTPDVPAPGLTEGQTQSVALAEPVATPAPDESAPVGIDVVYADDQPVAYVSTDSNGAVTYAANPDLPTGEDTAPSGQTDETDVLVVISSNWIDALSVQVEGYPEAFTLTPRGIRVPQAAVNSIIEQAAAQSVVVSTKG